MTESEYKTWKIRNEVITMTVQDLISSCNNVYYGAMRVNLYGRGSEQLHCVAGCVDEHWSKKEVDWWRIKRIKEYGSTILEMDIHVL